MNRRDFLKCGAAAIAAAALPVAALELDPPAPLLLGSTWEGVQFAKNPELRAAVENAHHDAWNDFKPDYYYGNGLHVMYRPPPEAEQKMLDTLYEDMCKIVPPPYRDRVYLHGSTTDYGHAMQLAWKYSPA